MTGDIDSVTLNFSPGSLLLLNAILAVVMFAIALDLKPDHFRALLRAPKPVIAGFLSQFLVLPAATYLLVLAVQPRPSQLRRVLFEHRLPHVGPTAGHDHRQP